MIRTLAAGAVVALLPSATLADESAIRERARERLAVEVDFGPRPVLVGNRLIWESHALLDLCEQLGGSFRKLTGRPEYACNLATPDAPFRTAHN
jgi:hypothetical protein